jgi:hypothetical protein
MSIESEARGISQRHKPWVGPDSRWHCELCHCLWGAHGCPDRLAADAITQKIKEAADEVQMMLDGWGEIEHYKGHAVAALASLTGQDDGA